MLASQIRKQWSDGLPIVPPTAERVDEFLKYTDRSPDEVLGVPMPSHREATVWNVAVNGGDGWMPSRVYAYPDGNGGGYG